jgi:DNA-binding NarL/FixJ family response regulator
MLHIFIIDEAILFREGLANLLNVEGEMRVIGEASSIAQALEKLGRVEADLALVNADMPGLEDFHVLRMLRARRPRLQILLLSRDESQRRFLEAVRNGARGYLQLDHSANELVQAVRAVARGEAVVPRSMTGLLLDEIVRLSPVVEQEEFCLLTPREIEVLRELGKGESNQQIARNLDIAENTVKVHVHNILEKLNLPNRRQAARFARRQGIATPDVHSFRSSYGFPSSNAL